MLQLWTSSRVRKCHGADGREAVGMGRKKVVRKASTPLLCVVFLLPRPNQALKRGAGAPSRIRDRRGSPDFSCRRLRAILRKLILRGLIGCLLCTYTNVRNPLASSQTSFQFLAFCSTIRLYYVGESAPESIEGLIESGRCVTSVLSSVQPCFRMGIYEIKLCTGKDNSYLACGMRFVD